MDFSVCRLIFYVYYVLYFEGTTLIKTKGIAFKGRATIDTLNRPAVLILPIPHYSAVSG
jgi:hypothetical protein